MVRVCKLKTGVGVIMITLCINSPGQNFLSGAGGTAQTVMPDPYLAFCFNCCTFEVISI